MSVESFYTALGVELPDRPGPELPLRCFVPEHDHRSGDRNPSASVNVETGQWYCHAAAGEGGNAYQAAIALGRTPAEAMALLEEHGLREDSPRPRVAPSTNGDLSEGAVKRFAVQLAADDAAIRRLEELRGWSAETVERLELGLDRDRIVFPVRDAGGVLVGRLRYAPDPSRRNGSKKLLADKGTPRELFPAPESLDAEAHLFTEGEPDAVSGHELGFAAVGIPGTGSADRFDPTRFAGRHVVICFDCDDAGRDAARKAAESLVPHAASVKVLDLDPNRDDGYDLGDYLLEAAEFGEQGKADARRLLERMAAAAEPMTAAEPVELAELLETLAGYVRRYVVMSPAQVAVVALWVVHTHAIDAADVTPFLGITSAEKRSGKSLLLDVLELLTARPWRVISPSEAVTFRKIERDEPTLLLDEVDAIFKAASERTEPLRALLNAGNRRGTTVPRCVGPNQELRDFSTFCARGLAGIGDLPSTVADRSLSIRLERRAAGEQVERYRRRLAEPEAQPLREALERFAAAAGDELRHAEPELPDELDDRAQDAAEPLLAIADMAGVEWPQRARDALVKVCAGRQAEDESIGVRLLDDIREVLGDQDRISTAELLERLNKLDESPWGDWYGKPLTSRALAKLLKPYGVKSRSVRLEDGSSPKGYRRDQLEAVWKRYLAVGGASIRHSATTRSQSGIEPDSETPQDPAVADTKTPPNPHEHCDVAGVADKSPDTGAGAP
ncbi:MAG: DUF3631 domain-containing protein [Actinomycetota bacterium]|nr:DUF3631 domain-containing protein [Actinomycetota bacterium]